MRALGLALPALLASAPAAAAWPEDVSLSGMLEHDGVRVTDRELLTADYEQLVRELAASVATATIPAPRTLGISGFEVVLESNVAFTDTSTASDGSPSPWQRAQADEDPGAFLFAPGFTARKGLPFSLEVGLTGRWVGMSRQGVFGGFARAGLVEGYKPWPDLSLTLGYTGYIGNDELELGVLNAGLTLGSSWTFGASDGAKTSRISPFLDVTLLVVYATPVLNDADVAALGANSFGGTTNNPDVDTLSPQAPLLMPRFTGGIELITGHFLLRITGGYTLNAVGNVAVAVGLSY